mmetsp:Transcript_19639/g.29309  ORF Transcript_19639/g.29309 Transcript_19639/m.29309 type:complete len:83 (-) Transcript_19639:979-1227(-)
MQLTISKNIDPSEEYYTTSFSVCQHSQQSFSFNVLAAPRRVVYRQRKKCHSQNPNNPKRIPQLLLPVPLDGPWIKWCFEGLW